MALEVKGVVPVVLSRIVAPKASPRVSLRITLLRIKTSSIARPLWGEWGTRACTYSMTSIPCNPTQLPVAVLEHVLLLLNDVSLACFAQCCRAGREASQSPSFWQTRCQLVFGHVTDLQEWQTAYAQGCFATADYSHLAPTSSRCADTGTCPSCTQCWAYLLNKRVPRGVYCLLRHLRSLVGLWQYQETGRFGKHHLVSCTWGSDHLQLMLVKVYDQGLRRTELAKVSAQGLWMLEQGADDRICVLRKFEAKPPSPIYSPAAAAAAAVAIMGHHRQVKAAAQQPGSYFRSHLSHLILLRDTMCCLGRLIHMFITRLSWHIPDVCWASQAEGLRDVSGTSPPGSFEHEMLRFMQVRSASKLGLPCTAMTAGAPPCCRSTA